MRFVPMSVQSRLQFEHLRGLEPWSLGTKVILILKSNIMDLFNIHWTMTMNVRKV